VNEKYAPWIIPVGILISLFLVFKPQIDWWWSNKYPPKTDRKAKAFIEKFYPYYAGLPESDKASFLHRMELIIQSIEWMPMGFEEIPADVQYVVASYYAHLTYKRDKFLFKYWEKIVLYKHPFPSPMHPKELHHSEIFPEDHVMLFDFPQMIKGYMKPQEVFPVGLYELARVYIHSFKTDLNFTVETLTPEVFRAITGQEFEWVEKSVGLKSLDPEAIAIVCYFIFPENTKQLAPGWYERCEIEWAG
jgi:hypothetical protein